MTWEKEDRTDYRKLNLEYMKVELLLKTNKILFRAYSTPHLCWSQLIFLVEAEQNTSISAN